jgi:tripartite-type tricarboxylate transporter receptor subunit TctC
VLPDAGRAAAQSYPSRQVRIVVGYPAGGVSDILARLTAQALSDRLGQAFVVENRPGAGSNIATELVARAPPDGHTLLLAGVANAINVTLYTDLSFNFIRDIAPVALIERAPLVMEVHPSVPATTVPEFIAYARANPRRLSMGSGGLGSPQHIAGELFMMMTGVKLVPVHYHGTGPALPDLLSGRLQVMFDLVTSSIGYIKAGKLRPLAVASNNRSDVLPDTPTWAELGFRDVIADNWSAVVAPAGTPPAIVAKLNAALNTAVADPELRARFAENGVSAMGGSPGDLAALIAGEMARWHVVVKQIGISAQGP